MAIGWAMPSNDSSTDQHSDRILRFYANQSGHGVPYRFEQVVNWPDEHLEACHDYIQWLFPTRKASAFNRDAPCLTASTIDAFARSEELRQQLDLALTRMLAFYGYRCSDGQITQATNFAEKAQNWLHPGNHNLLRISRMLDSLSSLGLQQQADAFLQQLELTADAYPDAIGHSLSFWRAALNQPASR